MSLSREQARVLIARLKEQQRTPGVCAVSIEDLDALDVALQRHLPPDAVVSGGEGYWNECEDVYTSPIDVGKWGARIECHGETREAAEFLRACVLSNMAIPEGYRLMPFVITEEMADAGRFAVMARECSSAKWSPRQHYEASGQSMQGIPDEDLASAGGMLPKSQGAALVYHAMYAKAPKVSGL